MWGKIHQVGVMAPFQLHFLVENGFRSLPFEKISVLDPYFVHRYIDLIIQYKSSSIRNKIYQLSWQLLPFSTAMSAL